MALSEDFNHNNNNNNVYISACSEKSEIEYPSLNIFLKELNIRMTRARPTIVKHCYGIM